MRVGGVALLARDAKGGWTRRDERDLNRELSKLYGFPLDFGRLRRRVDAVAAALGTAISPARRSARCCCSFPTLPHPRAPGDVLERRRLAQDLVACGLLKADADWDEKHPRAGAPPNPGWFAPSSRAGADKPKTDAKPAAGSSARGGAAPAFVPLGGGRGGSLLAEDLSATALEGLATLAARFSAATILFGVIFIPSANLIVEEGRFPGRPDVAYRWAHDETATAVTLEVLIDGQWRTLAVGGASPDGVVYDRDGRAVARVVSGPDRRQTLVATVDALDRAVADLRRKEGEPAAAPSLDDREPKLCPDPMEEPKTTKLANSIAYQEYVSGLRYGWAIILGIVRIRRQRMRRRASCSKPRPTSTSCMTRTITCTGGSNGKGPRNSDGRPSEGRPAAGRVVVWHAQTEKGYGGLKKIADRLPFGNLSVVYDPN